MLIVIVVNLITIVSGMIVVWITDVFQSMNAKIVATLIETALITTAA